MSAETPSEPQNPQGPPAQPAAGPSIPPGLWRRCMSRVHDLWECTRSVVSVLAIVRFSLLIPAVLAVTLIMADHMVDILRAVAEATFNK